MPSLDEQVLHRGDQVVALVRISDNLGAEPAVVEKRQQSQCFLHYLVWADLVALVELKCLAHVWNWFDDWGGVDLQLASEPVNEG